jgi:uncharacterized LabA/DUF88 family protein
MNDTEYRSSSSLLLGESKNNLVVSGDDFKVIDRELKINDAFPGLDKHEPTALLLDINNLFKRTRENGFRLDFARLHSLFSSRCNLRLASAFSAVDLQSDEALGWVDYMRKKGYEVETKRLMRYTNNEGEVTTKGNMDIEICLAAMDLSPSFGHIILGTCDGDFVPLVDRLKRGSYRRVSVLGITNSNLTGMSRSLMDAADHFYDMALVKDLLTYRKHSYE